jgi:hypothetical protein
VAERITTRFLNVISLFNGAIPLIAMQLNVLQVDDKIVLNFARVLDEVTLGVEDDDEPAGQPVDRTYWEQKASQESLAIVDDCLDILREVDNRLDFKFNNTTSA